MLQSFEWAPSAPQHDVQATRLPCAPGSTLQEPPGAENKSENNAQETGTLTWEVQPPCRACRAEASCLVLSKVSLTITTWECGASEQNSPCLWSDVSEVELGCHYTFSIPALPSQGLQNRIIAALSKIGYFCLRSLQMNSGNPNQNLVQVYWGKWEIARSTDDGKPHTLPFFRSLAV